MRVVKKQLDEHEHEGGGIVAFFSTRFASYGVQRLGGGHRYQIDIHLDWGLLDFPSVCLYKSKKKPVFKNLILLSVLGFPFALIFWVLFSVFFLFSFYVIGAINHFQDSFSSVEQRAFNWVNFILMSAFLLYAIYFCMFA